MCNIISSDEYQQGYPSKISLLISAYKSNERNLSRAIESVLMNMEGIDVEFVVVLDGQEIGDYLYLLELLKNRKYKIIEKENTGLTHSLNVGLQHCEGEFVARIDDDDCWLPDKLALQLDEFNKDPDLVLCGTNFEVYSSSGAFLWKQNIAITKFDVRKALKVKNVFCHSSVVFKRELIIKGGGYDEFFLTGQDYNLWIKLLANHNYNAVLLSNVLVRRYNSAGSISMTHRTSQKRNACINRMTAIKKFGYDFTSIFRLVIELSKLLVPYKIVKLLKGHKDY